jgi:glycosyltransferase involved in cell wall biosynthesis
MRVLAMLAAYPPARNAGSWVMTHQLLRALIARGHEADVVLTTDRGDPYELDGVRVWPHVDKRDPYRFLGKASVIVTHLDSAARPVTIGQMCGIPVVTLVHSIRPATAGLLRRRPSSLVVFNSQTMADQYAGQIPGRSIVVRPPVHVADYATTPGTHITLVNLSADKGAHTFYALAERLPDRKFLGVVGGYGDQIIRADLPNVEVIDHVPVDRMRDEVYARTRILLMPSAHESWGRVGVEAMCSGIPVIASPTPGLREALGAAGCFADPGDVDAWEEQVRRLLDGRRWRAASRRARTRAAELDPTDDLDVWVKEVEAIARTRIWPLRRRPA